MLGVRMFAFVVGWCVLTSTTTDTRVSAFTVPISSGGRIGTTATRFDGVRPLSLSNDDEPPRRSRIAGNARPPTAQELAIMDEMIEKLAAAPAYELPNAVRRAFRVLSSPAFFLQLAAAVDKTEPDSDKRKQLEALASNLVATLEAVVETTEEQLEERASQVQEVVQAAAEVDSGEFLVPLSTDRVEAVRTTLQGLPPTNLDEGFLSTLDAWMNKAHQDGMDLMVTILQQVLQIYAGTALGRARESMAPENAEIHDLLQKLLLETDADQWEAVIPPAQAKPLAKEIQKTLESIVLSLDAGSMAQRVQAEYLQELLKRVQAIQE